MSASKNNVEEILLIKDSNSRIVRIPKQMWENPTWNQKKAVRALKNQHYRPVGENETVEFRGAHHTFKLEPKTKKEKKPKAESVPEETNKE
ncbi:MAG: hypothetical protein WAT16_06965 [Saprospiraceae bacterium]|nr:hypothetical protein [Saprospiraceae bacterium]